MGAASLASSGTTPRHRFSTATTASTSATSKGTSPFRAFFSHAVAAFSAFDDGLFDARSGDNASSSFLPVSPASIFLDSASSFSTQAGRAAPHQPPPSISFRTSAARLSCASRFFWPARAASSAARFSRGRTGALARAMLARRLRASAFDGFAFPIATDWRRARDAFVSLGLRARFVLRAWAVCFPTRRRQRVSVRAARRSRRAASVSSLAASCRRRAGGG
mmetsp:Transcript_22395/g.63058  ORF Transcript_22395/g.63058 Transcript_22395/m.63058 type:complete len:221 (+) Transcript_22395:711-1373(+)